MNIMPQPAWQRITSGALAVFFLAIAARMLSDPVDWYSATPGVSSTGPMNSHFIRDIGAAFLMSGAAFAFCTRKTSSWELAAVGAIFPGIHGGIHLSDLLTGHSHGSVATDIFGVIAPGTVAMAIAIASVRNHFQNRVST